MSGLAALLAEHNPPSVYQWHSAAPVADVQHAVEVAGWCFRYLDGWTVEDRATFLKAAAASLELSDSGAESVDALSAALKDIDCGDHGLVLLWDGWAPYAREEARAFSVTLSVLGGRVAAERGGPFAVLLRGEGPAVAGVAELD